MFFHEKLTKWEGVIIVIIIAIVVIEVIGGIVFFGGGMSWVYLASGDACAPGQRPSKSPLKGDLQKQAGTPAHTGQTAHTIFPRPQPPPRKRGGGVLLRIPDRAFPFWCGLETAPP